MAEVVLHSITKRFGNCLAIDNVDLSVGDGEFVALLGPSGCGKSTLLRMIAGLERIDKGDLYIGGKRFNDVPPQHRSIAMVFQNYALFPHMNVQSNILFGLKIKKTPPAIMEKKLQWVVSLLELQGLEKRFPKQLSGGQRQRVALARALVLDPDVLLLDEPLSNLDAALRETAMEELKRIHRCVGTTIIYVTHNQIEAMTMSQRLALLNAGRIEQFDRPQTVYDYPKTIFAAQFIGSPSMNLFDGRIACYEGTVGIETSLGFLLIDKERSPQVHTMIGRSVRVGIRPQNITFVEHGISRRSSDTCIEVVVDLVEAMGDRSLIVARGGGDTVLRFFITREADIVPDQRIEVYADGRRMHLFDTETNLNIFYS